MSDGETLSLVPESGPPSGEASAALIVLLGLTFTGGRRPLDLAFCSDRQDQESFLVKAGARSAHCKLCKTRHRTVSLVEAVGASAISTGPDEVGPCIMLEELLTPIFRKILPRARDAGDGEPGESGRKRSKGAG
jgi:hypothetical protein